MALALELGFKIDGEVGQKTPDGDLARSGKGRLNVEAIVGEMRRLLAAGCEHVFLETVNRNTSFTNSIPAGKLLRVPIAHGEGCYFADADQLKRLEAGGQILWRYVNEKGQATEIANPNGSLQNIAGIMNERGNVAGLMPHPERAIEPLLGSDDGRLIFESVINALAEKARKAA